MYSIGINPYQGLFTKAQFQQGKMMTPGTRASMPAADGQTKEFVAVKLSAATWINGIAVIVDGLSASGVGAAAVTASAMPVPSINARVGILAFGSATATQTMAGTAFGWAQIYGSVLAWVSASVSVAGQQLGIGTSGQLIPQVAASASAMLLGITAITTLSASTPTNSMIAVMLTYPAFGGPNT